jgi:hypothetical protein
MTLKRCGGLGIILCITQAKCLELAEVFFVFLRIHFEFSDPLACQHDTRVLSPKLKPIVKPLQFFVATTMSLPS